MNQRVTALRIVAKFLSCCAEGAPVTAAEFKTMADMCWLQVPVKHRMEKSEIAQIAAHPWNTKGKGEQ